MLSNIKLSFNNIMNSDFSDYDRNLLLSELMTKMEREFNIPMLHDDAWEKSNADVILLYKLISNSRIL